MGWDEILEKMLPMVDAGDGIITLLDKYFWYIIIGGILLLIIGFMVVMRII